MLDLDALEWQRIPASCGPSGALTAALLRQVRSGDDSAYGELYHQVCHQFSVGTIAYVAVPHLVALARLVEGKRRVPPLNIIGTVAAARVAHPLSAAPLPDEWRAEYLAANDEARRLTADALSQGGWEGAESQQLLATLAALHGHINLAMHLFLQWGAAALSCPVCGEEIEFGEES